MSGPCELSVTVNGHPCRVWEKGKGERLGVLAGIGGLPRWTPFLDRLAERRHVVAPSLPGFPGGLGHDALDNHLDWLMAARDLLEAAGLVGADLVGISIGGALAADVAAVWPERVRRLALVSPLGLFDAGDPVADLFAQRPGALSGLLCGHPERFDALVAVPEGANDPVEWEIEQVRAMEAAARILWPLGDTELEKRLGAIRAPTLLLRGADDRVLPASYLERFAAGIAGPVTTQTIAGAGHLADLDAPDETASAVMDFLAAAEGGEVAGLRRSLA